MSHRNRQDLLFITLCTLNKSKQNNFEMVIIDDRSNHRIDFIKDQFKFPIKIIRIDNKDNDKIVCPGDLYNVAFESSVGEIIVIQNPECLHLGDIPTYIMDNFKYDDYLSFPCYSSNNTGVNDYVITNIDDLTINNIEQLTKNFNNDDKFGKFPIWFQHPAIRNKNLHFCTVISREYYQILGGFSRDYSNGFCFEDDQLIFDIKEKLKLNVISIPLEENIGVIHMYHGRSSLVNITPNETTIEKRAIYEKYHLNENIFKYNVSQNKNICVPKIFHYYWDDFRKFSYMNLYSLKSSIYYHPDYIHIIWCSINPQSNISWQGSCNKDYNQDSDYENYVNDIRKFKNARIIYKDMSKFLNVNDDMSEIHKSDLFRYKILHRYGGIWSDLDVVYIKPLSDIITYDFDAINFLCKIDNFLYFPIGLMLSRRSSSLYDYIFSQAIFNYDPEIYECVGSKLLAKLFLFDKCGYIRPRNTSININKKDILLDEEFYMKYNWDCVNRELFIESPTNPNLDKTIGFHWFNGSNVTKSYLKDIVNYTIPDKYKGILFEERDKFHNSFEQVVYFTFDIDSYGKFYVEKKLLYINIINKYYKTEAIHLGRYGNGVVPFLNKKCDVSMLYIFDELSYANLLLCYCNSNDINKKSIDNFLLNSRYICFFSELFMNTDLQTIGNPKTHKSLVLLFFRNAKRVILCNTKNFNYLVENDIYQNLSYFPPYGYSEINHIVPLATNDNKNIDIAFFGTIVQDSDYKHRIKYIEQLKDFSRRNNLTFVVFTDLYGKEKDELLKSTKIVIHIPSNNNLHTFPWAKVVELMSKKIFFIIEENEEMYIKNLENIVVYYKDKSDLYQKINYYLGRDDERNKYIECCYNHVIQHYNMDLFIKNLIDAN